MTTYVDKQDHDDVIARKKQLEVQLDKEQKKRREQVQNLQSQLNKANSLIARQEEIIHELQQPRPNAVVR